MSKRRTQAPATPPTISLEEGKRRLQTMRDKGHKLLSNRPLTENAANTWANSTLEYIKQTFGSDSSHITTFCGMPRIRISNGGPDVYTEYDEQEDAEQLAKRVQVLHHLIDQIDTELELSGSVGSQPDSDGTRSAVTRNEIFIVHGRDVSVLHEVARFLEKLGQDVVVLHELPNKGRTIIEKFEEYADVAFAIVLLTPDDVGAIATARDELRHRARQNVIFELGYFIGRLGRRKVCGLYLEGVDLPSDYDGVLYTKFDATGAWRLELAKELKAAGLAVDLNLAV